MKNFKLKKMIVETTGKFGLGDNSLRQEIQAFRPSVVQPSPFLSARIGLGQVTILVDDLPMIANDEDFKNCYDNCMKDKSDKVKAQDLALDSYTEEVNIVYKEELAKIKADKENAEDEAKASEAAAKKLAETKVNAKSKAK